jgi:PIN domain nuclease of toxin-antitoxin system
LLLLDTHVVLWLALQPEKISERAEHEMEEARRGAGGLAIAACTLWEIALFDSKGRLELDPPVEVFLERVEQTYRILQMDRQIAIRGNRFSPEYPSDPADRQIGATAVVRGLSLVTADQRILKSGEVPCLW